jgi:4-hydroxybenzoate polyprenyltransferase
MRRSPWSVTIVSLAVGSLALVGGTAIGGDIGPLTVGYGVLVVLAVLYAVAVLAIRDRVWRRLPRSGGTTRTQTLAGHRLF